MDAQQPTPNSGSGPSWSPPPDLQVVRDGDGGPISGGQAILRAIGYIISGSVFYLGYIWIFIDKRKRGWHDLIAGTVVVKRI